MTEDALIPASDILCRFENEFNKLFSLLSVDAESVTKDISVVGDPETLVDLASSCASSLLASGKAVRICLDEEDRGVTLAFIPVTAKIDTENYVFSPMPLLKLMTAAEPYIWQVKKTDRGGYKIILGKKVEKSAQTGEFPLRDVEDTVIRSIILKYIRRK